MVSFSINIYMFRVYWTISFGWKNCNMSAVGAPNNYRESMFVVKSIKKLVENEKKTYFLHFSFVVQF